MSTRTRKKRRRARFSAVLMGLLCATLLQGCYYLQAVQGQVGIWNKSRPLEDVINDPATDGALRQRLVLLRDARDFASGVLLLPDNGSYRKYADLERDYVLWNVVAAPEFSLQPRTWCYLVVGCLAYRGYFAQDAATRLAERLRGQGYDVHVGGVPAYSTLGRFDDPLLNTMLQRDDAGLVALLFHELAHQRLYLKGDTAFNESFATAVAELGLREWFRTRGDTQSAHRWQQRQASAESLMQEVNATRAQLAELFARDLPPAQMRIGKQALFADLRQALGRDPRRANFWQSIEMNNAWLATMSLYRGHMPAFRRLFADCEADWHCFYVAVDEVAELSPAARAQSLAELGDS